MSAPQTGTGTEVTLEQSNIQIKLHKKERISVNVKYCFFYWANFRMKRQQMQVHVIKKINNKGKENYVKVNTNEETRNNIKYYFVYFFILAFTTTTYLVKIPQIIISKH